MAKLFESEVASLCSAAYSPERVLTSFGSEDLQIYLALPLRQYREWEPGLARPGLQSLSITCMCCRWDTGGQIHAKDLLMH